MTQTAQNPAPIHVVGGGLAGSEAAWQIASAGVPVVLHEMRPLRAPTPTRPIGSPNWSAPIPSAPTILGQCRGRAASGNAGMDSLIMAAADADQVPAGGALAVDREGFPPLWTRRSAAIR